MKRIWLFYTAFQTLRRYLCKHLQDTATSSFISCCFTPVFTSADINFLQLFRALFTIIKKKKKKKKIPFLTDLPKPPFHYRQKSAKHDSFFCWCFWIAVAIRHPITTLLNMFLKNTTTVQSWSNLVPLVHSCSDPPKNYDRGIWVGLLVISHMKLGSDTLHLYFFNVSYNNNPKIPLASLTSIETTLINSTTLWKFLFLIT